MTPRWTFGLLLPFLLASGSNAQENYRRGELSIGYSFRTVRLPGYSSTAQVGEPAVVVDPQRENSHGWALNLTGNPHKAIGFTIDVSRQYGSVSALTCPVFPAGQASTVSPCYVEPRDTNSYQFLAGPRFALRSGRVTEYAHALLGAFHFSTTGANPLNATKFAVGFGGGVDVGINRHIAIRAFQVDYIPVRAFDAQSGWGGYRTDWRHHLRFQTGVVFRLGWG